MHQKAEKAHCFGFCLESIASRHTSPFLKGFEVQMRLLVGCEQPLRLSHWKRNSHVHRPSRVDVPPQVNTVSPDRSLFEHASVDIYHGLGYVRLLAPQF